MKRLAFWKATAAFAASFATTSWGLGLGDASIQSHFNEPLRAELTLLEAGTLGPGEIRIGLASAQAFERLGIARPQFLAKLNFEVQASGSAAVAVMTTEQPLREPSLNFVVEARWPEGRLLREYTLLIDPPPVETNDTSSIVVASPTSVSEVAEKEPRVEEGNAGEVMRPGGTYLVRNADTLWRITSAARPEGVTMDQAMLSIVETNLAAFKGGNVNGLKSGYLLSLPTADAISIAVAEARAEVLRQNAIWAGVEPPVTPGFTVISDPGTAAQLLLTEETQGVEAATNRVLQDGEGVESAVSAESRPPVQQQGSASPEVTALLSKVETLERNLARMVRQLNDRDAELERLRAQLTVVTAREQDSDAETQVTAVDPIKAIPEWVWLAAVGVLISGGLGMWWAQRQRATSGSDVGRIANSGAPLVPPETESQDTIVMPVSRALSEVAEEPTAMGAAPEESTAPQPEQDSLDVASAVSFSTMRDSEGGQVDAGLSLVPVSDLPEGSSASQGLRSSYQESVLMEESIYGLETDPVDSKLDLARAYLDMGDEAGARLVLSEVIKEGNESQQAEARTLLLRLEVS